MAISLLLPRETRHHFDRWVLRNKTLTDDEIEDGNSLYARDVFAARLPWLADGKPR